MKIHIRGFFFSLLFSALGIINTSAQNNSKYLQLDSTVVRMADNSELVEYFVRESELRQVPRQTKTVKRALASAEKGVNLEKQLSGKTAVSRIAMSSASRMASVANLSSYSVGAIPLQEGMTPAGARTYQIPITAASGFNLTPSISVCYNSQASEGWAGYGWDIGGFSKIELVSKNKYYHGENKGANKVNTDAVFALDGNPLVQNTQSATNSAYPLITATGNILVAPVKNSAGYVTKFNVKYPNGQTAVYTSFLAGSTSNSWCYSIAELTDLNGGKVTYSYAFGAEVDRLESIRYGYNSSGEYKAEIILSYESSNDVPNRHYAGWSVAKTSRLKSITSKSDGNTICQYTFSYIQKDNVSLLSQVRCISGNEELPPLRFEYEDEDEPQPTSDYLYEEDYGHFLKQFSSPSGDFFYKRGKLMMGSQNDGVIIYPQYDNYYVKTIKKPFLSSKKYSFWSPYPVDQPILIAPSLKDYATDVSAVITTGDGFQTIEAVDVDGDGQDELVKVNFNGTSGSNTRLLITIYKCNTSGQPVQNAQFEVLVKGTITSGDFVSPYRREYYWGDFRGNGKTQLLTVAYDKNYNEEKDFDQVSYTTLIDLSSREVLCDSKLFDFSLEHYRYLLVCDLDNDSQTELCFSTSSGLDVYRFRSSSFVKERTIPGVDQTFWNNTDRPYFMTDINGDGYIDILCPPAAGSSTTWTWKSYNGSDFTNYSLNICKRLTSDEFMFIDINRDGLADLVKVNGTALGCYINTNGHQFGSYQPSPSTVTNKKGIVSANVVDFMGASCFIVLENFNVYMYKYTSKSPCLRQLKKAIDSFGRMTVNKYAYLPEKQNRILGSGWWDNSLSVNNSDGYSFRTPQIYVLEQEDAFSPEGSFNNKYLSRSYIYYNAVVHNQGLGFCGFSKIRSTEFVSGEKPVIVEEIYDPQKRGVLKQIIKRLSSITNSPFYTATNTYDNNSTTYGKLNPRLTQAIESNILTGVVTTSTLTYGSYDLPTKIITTRRITSKVQTETLTRSYQNTVSSSKYLLGLVTEEAVVKEGDGDTSLSWKEKTVNTYDSYGRLSTSKLYVGPYGERPTGNVDATNLVSETRWQYDSYGNITSKRTASYGATSFLSEAYTYDADGRYLLSETDVLGHKTTFSDYDKFGNPTIIKDYRDRTTTCVFDAWGTLTKKTHADGAVEQITLAWGGAGLYTVTKSVTGAPETIVHYDAFEREIKSGQKRFNGQWQYVEKVYDNKGRISETSLPYRGSSASYWNEYKYDDYGRPLSVIEASGKKSTWSYSGVSTTAIKEGISSTSTTDPSGNIIRVVDEGGAITYTLRDDGQPASITAPGNVKTTFAYDDYGRKIQIIDPSAGTQTDSYVWNSDGSSVQTHVNPNGTIKTYTDKYGRVTKIERPGEYTTTYTYNSYGLLTKEQSTNGTSTEYTYDAQDRISTVKEVVPDGKWLQKTCTYTTGSVLSKISYTSQTGSITTETYTYANGYNTKITLANGTVVWNLTAENDLGQPTAGTTGNVAREYGYTAFGMPTYRRMAGGALQDMRYQFDPATGNLTMRRDETRNKTENFSYDKLNRLETIGTRQIVYADNGNILSMDGVGSMGYDSREHPYQVTSLTTASSSVVANRAQSVTYTCYSRPSTISEGGRSVAFTYNGDGDRVKMYEANGSTQVLTRYYIGGQYEFDQTPSGTKERLYVGGDAYSAPMVYQREGSGSWTAYNIGRDYLGNITHIATASGTLVAEYSYDPWGRLRNPSTLAIYAAGSEPTLFLGRGFSGHEHLAWFGLINMNARLYDPTLGRFLSPDPLVQNPSFTQNYNRYSYVFNNPLKYVDESGEAAGVDDGIAALIGGALNWATHGCRFDKVGAIYFGLGAAAGVACIYVSPVVACGTLEALNSIVEQGYGSGTEFNKNNVKVDKVLLAFAEGAAFSKFGGFLSDKLSGFLGKLTSRIPGQAWSMMLNQGLTGYATGFVISGAVYAMTSYSETGKVDWKKTLQCANAAGCMGLVTGSISGMAAGIKEAHKQGENPWAFKKDDLYTAKSLGLTGDVNRIEQGISSGRKNDGGVWQNRDHDLPTHTAEGEAINYIEHDVLPPGWGNGAKIGPKRIVTGSDGSWYYTPDHYKTFIKFKR